MRFTYASQKYAIKSPIHANLSPARRSIVMEQQCKPETWNHVVKTCTEFEPYFGPHLPPPRPASLPLGAHIRCSGLEGLKWCQDLLALSLSFAGMAGQLLLRPPPSSWQGSRHRVRATHCYTYWLCVLCRRVV